MRAKIINKNVKEFQRGKYYIVSGIPNNENCYIIEYIAFKNVKVNEKYIGECSMCIEDGILKATNQIYYVKPEWCYETDKSIQNGCMMYDENGSTYVSEGF